MKKWNQLSLVLRISIGMVVGLFLASLLKISQDFGYTFFNFLNIVPLFGTLFVKALKSVAPILVFFLVASAISQHKQGQKTNMKSVLILYLVGTFLASLIAVIASFIFPVALKLGAAADTANIPPQGVSAVLTTLLLNIVSNPIEALKNANYIGILSFATVLGLALRHAKDSTKETLLDWSNGISQIVRWIINLAPFGIMGLVFTTVMESGMEGFITYGRLLLLLVGTMLFVALVVNPLMAFVVLKTNPYPLVFRCLRVSGITAFFTRSSAANIPVNMELCEELKLDPDTYSVSIPLGATINMAGAAITISILTLAAAHTLGLKVDFITALILSILSAVSACGASGVAGGSLLLIPLACSLFGIPNDIAMQVVGVGFIIGVIQDSCETALNSSTDVLFTAVSDYAQKKKDALKN